MVPILWNAFSDDIHALLGLVSSGHARASLGWPLDGDPRVWAVFIRGMVLATYFNCLMF